MSRAQSAAERARHELRRGGIIDGVRILRSMMGQWLVTWGRGSVETLAVLRTFTSRAEAEDYVLRELLGYDHAA